MGKKAGTHTAETWPEVRQRVRVIHRTGADTPANRGSVSTRVLGCSFLEILLGVLGHTYLQCIFFISVHGLCSEMGLWETRRVRGRSGTSAYLSSLAPE